VTAYSGLRELLHELACLGDQRGGASVLSRIEQLTTDPRQRDRAPGRVVDPPRVQ
jgi:hypothetical protein